MARVSALAIGDGGAYGWLTPQSMEFPDPGQPTLTYIPLVYRVSGESEQQNINFNMFTDWTTAVIRSTMKDLIKADILAKFGVNIPKSAIKVECPE